MLNLKRKSNSILFVLGATSLVLFSCQPKDVTLNTKPAFKDSKTTVGVLSTTESNKLLSLSIDRQLEPIHLLKAILNPKYADAHGLVLAENAELKTLELKAKSGLFVIDTALFASEYSVNYEVQKIETDKNKKLTLMILKNISNLLSDSKSYFKKGDKKTDFTSKAMTEFISIKATDVENEYLVNVDRVDETSSAVDKQTTIYSTISSVLKWDGLVESLDSDLLVKLNTLNIDRKGNKSGTLKYEKIDSEFLTVKLDQCISVNGKINLTQKIETKDEKMTLTGSQLVDSTVVLTDSSLVMTTNAFVFTSKAQPCENRPVVDLTKML